MAHIYARTGEPPEKVWALPAGRRAFRFEAIKMVLREEAQAMGGFAVGG